MEIGDYWLLCLEARRRVSQRLSQKPGKLADQKKVTTAVASYCIPSLSNGLKIIALTNLKKKRKRTESLGRFATTLGISRYSSVHLRSFPINFHDIYTSLSISGSARLFQISFVVLLVSSCTFLSTCNVTLPNQRYKTPTACSARGLPSAPR